MGKSFWGVFFCFCFFLILSQRWWVDRKEMEVYCQILYTFFFFYFFFLRSNIHYPFLLLFWAGRDGWWDDGQGHSLWRCQQWIYFLFSVQRETQDRMLKTVEQRHTIDFFKDTLKTLIHQSDKKPVGRCLATMGHSQIYTDGRTHTYTHSHKHTNKRHREKTHMPAKSTPCFHCDPARWMGPGWHLCPRMQ